MAANSSCSESWSSKIYFKLRTAPPKTPEILSGCHPMVWFRMGHIAGSVQTFRSSCSLAKYCFYALEDAEYLATQLAALRLRFSADGASSPPKTSIRFKSAFKPHIRA
jgi:hypothetical protein